MSKYRIFWCTCMLVCLAVPAYADVCFLPNKSCGEFSSKSGSDFEPSSSKDCTGYNESSAKGEGWDCESCGGKYKCTIKTCPEGYDTTACKSTEVSNCNGYSGNDKCCKCTDSATVCLNKNFLYKKTTNNICSTDASNVCRENSSYYKSCTCPADYTETSNSDACYVYETCDRGHQRVSQIYYKKTSGKHKYKGTANYIPESNLSSYPSSTYNCELKGTDCDGVKYYTCAKKPVEDPCKNTEIEYGFGFDSGWNGNFLQTTVYTSCDKRDVSVTEAGCYWILGLGSDEPPSVGYYEVDLYLSEISSRQIQAWDYNMASKPWNKKSNVYAEPGPKNSEWIFVGRTKFFPIRYTPGGNNIEYCVPDDSDAGTSCYEIVDWGMPDSGMPSRAEICKEVLIDEGMIPGGCEQIYPTTQGWASSTPAIYGTDYKITDSVTCKGVTYDQYAAKKKYDSNPAIYGTIPSSKCTTEYGAANYDECCNAYYGNKKKINGKYKYVNKPIYDNNEVDEKGNIHCVYNDGNR